MLEQLLAKALPVYSRLFCFLKKWTIIVLGLSLNLTFYVLLVGYSKLPKEGAVKWIFSYTFLEINSLRQF